MIYSGIDPASGDHLDVSVGKGIIASIEASSIPAAGLPNMSHGFIDMQVNGCRGCDYSREDLDPRRIELIAESLTAGIIADGFHLPASVLKAFARAKGLERLILVSDAAAPAGLEPGRHRWGNLDTELFPDGHIGLAGTPMRSVFAQGIRRGCSRSAIISARFRRERRLILCSSGFGARVKS